MDKINYKHPMKNDKNIEIVPADSRIIDITLLFLQKLEKLTERERDAIIDFVIVINSPIHHYKDKK